jgi:hypothetical protein
MKRIISVIATAAIVFASCESKKTETAAVETPKGTGYTLDSSANIELVKKMNYAFPAGDSVTVFGSYSDTAKVHDNLHTVSIKEDFREFNSMLAKGLVLKVEKIDAIFETVHNEAFPDGVTSHVTAWVTLSAQRGKKSITFIMNQGVAFKNGKIVEEWDTYDTAGLMDLMK